MCSEGGGGEREEGETVESLGVWQYTPIGGWVGGRDSTVVYVVCMTG